MTSFVMGGRVATAFPTKVDLPMADSLRCGAILKEIALSSLAFVGGLLAWVPHSSAVGKLPP